MIKSKYPATGNIAVDMVGAALSHYRHFRKQVEIIYLSHAYWKLFADYAKKKRPAFKFDEAIAFEDVMVMKGHRFMKENLEVKLKDLNTKKPVLN